MTTAISLSQPSYRQRARIIWLLIAAMAAAVAISFLLLGLSIDLRSNPALIASCIGYAGFCYIYTKIRRDERIASAAITAGQLFLVLFIGLLLTYAATATAMPYRDAELYALDQWLGLDRKTYLAFIAHHALLQQILDAAYLSIQPQTVLVPFVLIMAGQLPRLQSFIVAFGVALIVTAITASFIPAVSAFIHVDLGPQGYAALPAGHYTHVPTLEALRSGAMHAIPLNNLEGLITFPSFHTANGILFAWAFWKVPYVRWAGIAVNALLILSTPTAGAHYFVDVAAGAVVALLSIAMAGWILRPRPAIDKQKSAAVDIGSIEKIPGTPTQSCADGRA